MFFNSLCSGTITSSHSVWFFAGADIFTSAAIVLPFRQGGAVSLSAGRRPAVMKVVAFQAKVSRWIENFDRDGYFCLRGCFWLEKPNFHKELQVTNFELRMRSSALFNLRLSTWTYLFFLADQRWSFSRWFTLIYFLRPSAISICEYLRELFFLNFLTHAQIFPKTTLLLR
jgi:hypothetical protein